MAKNNVTSSVVQGALAAAVATLASKLVSDLYDSLKTRLGKSPR
jgi:hypothetical protein